MKKSDLQVYFYTLSKRFENMLHDPKIQWSDYQRLASDALVVLGRTVEEWPDNEQAEKVKGKLEQQESCPYCHGG